MLPTIPLDRPVLGRDLEALREKLNRTALECCFLLGIPLTTWADWKRHEDNPLPNPTAALAVRLYDRFPELAPAEPNPAVLRERLTETTGRRMTLAELSLLLGREKTSGYRWQTRGEPSLTVSRLIRGLMQLLENQGPGGLDAYLDLVKGEALARGISDLREAGAWKPK
jgi:hypothetical protein